jgi:uncharacterized protein YciI
MRKKNVLRIEFISAIFLILMIFSSQNIFGQIPNERYDSTLAKSLNADDYGMKTYVLILLKQGSVISLGKSKQDSIFKGHMDNINRLALEGKLVVAGPMGKNDKYRGIFILNVNTIDEARKLINTDPAIMSKLLDADLFIWYGSAALQETLKIHAKIEKKKF